MFYFRFLVQLIMGIRTISSIKQFTWGSILILLLTFTLPAASYCQAEKVVSELSENQPDIASVKLDGKALFTVHGLQNISAERRAEAISDRIKKVARNSVITSDSVKIITEGNQIKIVAGTELIMYVIDPNGVVSKQVAAAEIYYLKIKSAIQTYRDNRGKPALIKSSLFALGASLLLIVVMVFSLWLIKRINLFLQNLIKNHIDTVQNKSYNLIRSNQLWSAFNVLFKTIKIVSAIVIVAIFVQYILGLFPWTSDFASYTLELFFNPIKSMYHGFIGYLPSLAFLIVIFFVTRYLLKLVKLLFTGVDQGSIVIQDFDPEWALPTFRIIRIFIIAFAVIVAYPYIPGSGTSAFKGVTVFIGVLFSLGSSSFIGNIIAGYSMTYRRAFKKGDRILVDNQFGIVEDQKLLVTRLRSTKNEEIIIPNSVLLGSQIVNYSTKAKESGLILHTTVGIGYETPWRQVDAMLKLAADRTEGIEKEPAPFVIKKSLGDFAVVYEINVYLKNVDKLIPCYNRLYENILDVFNENNVQIMTPAYEGDPEIPKLVPKDQWHIPLVNDK